MRFRPCVTFIKLDHPYHLESLYMAGCEAFRAWNSVQVEPRISIYACIPVWPLEPGN